MVVHVFPNAKAAKDWAEKKNKTAKKYKWVIMDESYIVSGSGNTRKDCMVIKKKK